MAPSTTSSLLSAAAALLLAAAPLVRADCDPTKLDNSTYNYDITVAGTTVADVANATGRGICDIGRWNLMADVTITPNVGESFLIPAQTCYPDNESCLLKPENNPNATCLLGGPRLYYTVNGDTYDKIALRLGMNVSAITSSSNGGPGGYGGSSTNTSAELEAGQYIKIPQCSPSQCILQPYSFSWGVYKDLADEYNTTVGQIMMLSVTYNYSSIAMEGGSYPPINLPINCTALSDNITVLE